MVVPARDKVLSTEGGITHRPHQLYRLITQQVQPRLARRDLGRCGADGSRKHGCAQTRSWCRERSSVCVENSRRLLLTMRDAKRNDEPRKKVVLKDQVFAERSLRAGRQHQLLQMTKPATALGRSTASAMPIGPPQSCTTSTKSRSSR